MTSITSVERKRFDILAALPEKRIHASVKMQIFITHLWDRRYSVAFT